MFAWRHGRLQALQFRNFVGCYPRIEWSLRPLVFNTPPDWVASVTISLSLLSRLSIPRRCNRPASSGMLLSIHARFNRPPSSRRLLSAPNAVVTHHQVGISGSGIRANFSASSSTPIKPAQRWTTPQWYIVLDGDDEDEAGGGGGVRWAGRGAGGGGSAGGGAGGVGSTAGGTAAKARRQGALGEHASPRAQQAQQAQALRNFVTLDSDSDGW